MLIENKTLCCMEEILREKNIFSPIHYYYKSYHDLLAFTTYSTIFAKLYTER